MMNGRDKLGRFLKGHVGNPAGKAPGKTPVTNLLKKMMTAEEEGNMSQLEVMARKLYHMAIYEDDLQAIRYIIDRLDGVPKRAVRIDEVTEFDTLDEFDEAPPREVWDRAREIFLEERNNETA